MRLPRVRFTVRRMMVAVAVVAFAAWLIVPVVRILNDPGRHWLTHLWQRPDGSHLYSSHEVAFWARYRRELLGLPWDCRFNLCKENSRVCRIGPDGFGFEARLLGLLPHQAERRVALHDLLRDQGAIAHRGPDVHL